MTDIKASAQQVKDALDKIAAVKNNPQQVQQAINDAKAKVDDLCKQAEEA